MQPPRAGLVSTTSSIGGYPTSTVVRPTTLTPVQVQPTTIRPAPAALTAFRSGSIVGQQPAAATVLRPGATSVPRLVAAQASATSVAVSPGATTNATYSVPSTTQAMPVMYTRVPGSAPVVQHPTILTQAPAMRVEARPNNLTGPGLTQRAYEQKHHDDPQLQNLKELRWTCGLKNVPVDEGLYQLKTAATDGTLSRETFLIVYNQLLEAHGVEPPADDVQNAVFDLFDRDDNNVVDMMELICGISLLCSGSEEDKIHAVFSVFDENGDGFISMDEMFKFLASVFKVVLTPNVMVVMNSMGVTVESAEDLASVTTMECFKMADLNKDGKLSTAEFKSWFYAPRNDPSFLFSPVRKMLQ